MPNYRFLQLDVFTSTPFAGNPLAVFPEADGLTDEQMMKIAREMNLSETVFVLPPKPTTDTAKPTVLRRLRIFTPTREIPFAGHPIVGTWNCLAREGVVPIPEAGKGVSRIHHEVGIGVLPVDIEFADGLPRQVVMTQGAFEIVDEIDDSHEQAELARALGLAREDLDESLPIQAISTGLPSLAVPIRSLADLRDCRVNSSLLGEIYTKHGASGCLAFARETVEVGPARAHARFFAPADNIAEDPATGSACGALGGYLIHHGGLASLEPVEGNYNFVIEQGDFIHRPSRINLEVKGSQGKVAQVRVGGPSVVVAKGEVIL
ncbi:MAG TPA: PhzF family phenazine biosynthesis protein [Pyrinomonadaceae bacterium]|nr:PhzF family phenazine biosynthesis protein [Pyrinomonadaceae bacterium]